MLSTCLTEEGHAQAVKAGEALKNYFATNQGCGAVHRRIWVSPYRRTRQTATHVIESTGDTFFADLKESILLGEQQFGLFEGLDATEVAENHPLESKHFAKAIKYGGRFWARPPLGGSRFDVSVRVLQLVDQIVLDEHLDGVCDVVLVGHGLTLRAFAMMWLEKTAEWLDREPNPNNCSIRLIEGTEDKGYIFEGFSPSLKERKQKDVVDVVVPQKHSAV